MVMEKTYRVSTRESWGSNIKRAFVGALIGIALFIGSFFLLSWNEGNSVKVHAALDWAKATLVEAALSPLDPQLEGKVVHLSGQSTTSEVLTDLAFGISVTKALRLKRTVEMYQWEERTKTTSKDNLGGSTTNTTDYTYRKVWSGQPIDSSKFQVPTGFENPAMPIQTTVFDAKQATLGDHTLSKALLKKLTDFTQPVSPTAVPDYKIYEETLYQGADPANPAIGDISVSFSLVPTGDLSLIGQQRGKSIIPAKAPSGREVFLVTTKIASPSEMIEAGHKQQTLLTWALRAGGLIAMWLGLMLLLSPLAALLKVIPGLNLIFNIGVGFLAFAVALLLSASTIALAWLAYRPILSGGMLAGAAALALIIWLIRQPKATRTFN